MKSSNYPHQKIKLGGRTNRIDSSFSNFLHGPDTGLRKKEIEYAIKGQHFVCCSLGDSTVLITDA